ncbi:hypothetical protein WT58_23990 [Burkholderia territorii]|uniref:hypothetical protein n=1 Tax=Burkholderia territorii TaxID=1503055 RepID=UPI00075E898F|nr:hypothetical protein [Burkholderia territorii]KWH03698.1 hypothetical protein WT58_23990 [Burkholderia territorii]
MQRDNFKGFSLFNDIEDTALQTQNRARVLFNIAEDHIKSQRINQKGVALILGYFNCVPEAERLSVQTVFKDLMLKNGFILEAR